MSSFDWEEVKRLAADFQRAQLTSSSLSLSERNCVEVINKLVSLNLLDVIFTADGKEYITPQYLIKEIKDELYVSGGRVNLVELSKNLNVDLSHVAKYATEVEKSVSGCIQLMGQLIDKSYVTSICDDINEKLRTQGHVNVSDLVRIYDLPSDFLQQVIEKHLGKSILAKQDKVDSRLFFTEAFVEHNKRIVRGALTGLTRPTAVSTILQITGLSERDFFSAFDTLFEERQILGALTNRQASTSNFIPYVFTKQQNEWVDNFYKQNGYLEYDALSRLGISEPVNFVRRHFSNTKGLVELPSCVVGPQLLAQVDASVEESIVSGSYVDLSIILPSVFSEADISKIIELCLKRLKCKAQVYTFCGTILVTEKFLQNVCKPFYDKGVITMKAEEVVQNGSYVQSLAEKKMSKYAGDIDDGKGDKKEERRKKAVSGKGGGGTQGRETKTKSVKRKGGRGNKHDEEDDLSDDDVRKPSKTVQQLEPLSVKEVQQVLANNPEFADEDGSDLVSEIAVHLLPTLNKNCLEAAQEIYERTLLNSAGDRRKAHSALQDKCEQKLTELRLYEKGIKVVSNSSEVDKDTQSKLVSYLIRTIATELASSIFVFLAQENLSHLQVTDKDLSAEMRNKIINELPGEMKAPLTKLHKALSGNSIDDFFSAAEVALPVVDLVVKKIDKKKEKLFMQNHRASLLDQLSNTDDPALTLHIAVLIIFQTTTQSVIHASGKFVPILLRFLKPQLSPNDYTVLQNCQDLVLKLVTTGAAYPELQSQIKGELNEIMPAVKDIVTNYKKYHPDKE